jgi:hypothetical protein
VGLQAQEGLVYAGLVLVEPQVEVGVLGVLLGSNGALLVGQLLRGRNAQLRTHLQPLLVEVVKEVNQSGPGSTGGFEDEFGGGLWRNARRVPGDSRGDTFTNLRGISLALPTSISAFFCIFKGI